MQESTIIVEDVVNALTGVSGADPNDQRDLTSQMERAAAEFDKRTATAFGRALLDSLCDEPGNLRQLEALIILGLAHPDVLDQNRISLAVEGRRLAVLLERSGEMDRARGVLELLASRLPEERTIDHELAGMMRRSGNTEQLVDRYMRRAEQAIAQGSTSEAIPWLQEVLLLDRTRRDVARMIRDLRYQEADHVSARRKRNKVLVVVAGLAAVITVVVGRELSIAKAVKGVEQVSNTDYAGLQARAASLQTILDQNVFWTKSSKVKAEISEIRAGLIQIEDMRERDIKAAITLLEKQAEDAEVARVQGLVLSEQEKFEDAISRFNTALELAPPGWEHREQIEKDVEALRRWKAGQR